MNVGSFGRMPPVEPLLQPGQPPGSAGNNAPDTDIPRRLRIRARQRWNPSVTDVIVNTRPDVGGLGRRNSPRVHAALENAFTIRGISSCADGSSPFDRQGAEIDREAVA